MPTLRTQTWRCLTLPTSQRDQFNWIAHSTTMPHALVQRARMILATPKA